MRGRSTELTHAKRKRRPVVPELLAIDSSGQWQDSRVVGWRRGLASTGGRELRKWQL